MTGSEIPSSDQLSAAWERLLAALTKAAELVNEHASSDLDRAEGHRFLTRLLNCGSVMVVENTDPDRPNFVRVMTETRKLMGDNPDTHYDIAPLTSRRSYRISGQLGEADYLGFCLYGTPSAGAGNAGSDGVRGNRIVANLSDRDFHVDRDGRFEIHLAPERPAGARDWIRLEPDAHSIIARQYFFHRGTQAPAQLAIEALGATAEDPPLTSHLAARRIGDLARWLEAVVSVTAIAGAAVSKRPNAVVVNASGGGTSAALYPTPDNHYMGGWFEIEPDQALVIEGRPPDARYWALQLLNRWMESLDYRYHRVSRNVAETALEDDGSFRFVIAHEELGLRNGLSTAGHRGGYFLFRWMQAEPPDPPRVRIVPLADVAS